MVTITTRLGPEQNSPAEALFFGERQFAVASGSFAAYDFADN